MGRGSNGPRGLGNARLLVEDMKYRPPSPDGWPRLGTETLNPFD